MRSEIEIVSYGDKKNPFIIRDIGENSRSVTNDAEAVVEYLTVSGAIQENLRSGQQLLYYDSEGQLDEILHKNGKFVGFKPGPR